MLAEIADEYGIAPGALDVSVQCTPSGADCPSAGVTVTVTVTTRASLPLVPAVLGLDRAAAIPIEARAMQKVSRQWGTG